MQQRIKNLQHYSYNLGYCKYVINCTIYNLKYRETTILERKELIKKVKR